MGLWQLCCSIKDKHSTVALAEHVDSLFKLHQEACALVALFVQHTMIAAGAQQPLFDIFIHQQQNITRTVNRYLKMLLLLLLLLDPCSTFGKVRV